MPFKQKTCAICNELYQPTGSTQKVCSGCKPEYKRLQNIAALRKLRKKQNKTPKGSILMCSDCGDDFVYGSGPQKRCKPCQKSYSISKIHEWLASDKERLAKYVKKARDNYSFGGNRKKALERDDYTCQHCGTKDDLHVHHIDGKGVTTEKEFRNNSLSNLITLCRSCHRIEHGRMNHST